MARKLLRWVACIFLLTSTIIARADSPATTQATTQASLLVPANLAIVARVSTSFVSGHESLDAINDGVTPRRSNDTSHGAYGNWPRHGTQWVQYDWPVAVSANGVQVYWYDDARGVRVPSAARLLCWSGTDWSPILTATIGLRPNTFNSAVFAEIKTTKLRLEMDGAGDSSCGVIEWRVDDSGNSPDFPPIVKAGVDRVVMLDGPTFLHGSTRSTGKINAPHDVHWQKLDGPAEVDFADPTAVDTAATFSAAGDYTLAIEAGSGTLETKDILHVHADPIMTPTDLRPVDPIHYSLNSTFWQPRIKSLIDRWIPHCVDEISKLDLKEGGIDNLIQAGNKLAGRPFKPHVGYPFSNAWVFNTVESMCDAQMVDAQGDAEITAFQQAMRQKLEEWIPIMLAAQEPDGYLQTRITLGTPSEQGATVPRWSPRLRGEHEGYAAGYFLEAAIADYLSTGGKDRRLYDAAKRLADCWDAHIGPPPKQAWYDGHEEMEMALLRFARLVNQVDGVGQGDKYAALGQFLLDCRGQRGGTMYDQTYLPVTQQYTAAGHAVRAVYEMSAMADVARFTGSVNYQSAVRSMWDDLVDRKYYITGGVGSGETSEGFGADYSLPTHAYCESCSGCGELFFQHKMNLLYGDAKYVDLYEDNLYNAILSDIDLAGNNFTYTNSLDSAEGRYPWHVCPCCVGNIPRTLLQLPSWMYATGKDAIDINLFVGSTLTLPNVAGTDVTLTQRTNYPWDGKVSIDVNPASQTPFSIRIRVPNRNVSKLYTATPSADGIGPITLNGSPVSTQMKNGYAILTRTWKAGDRIDFELPMSVQRVSSSDKITATRGKTALRYGPLVYNIESVDQNVDSKLAADAPLSTEWKSDLLGGVMAIHGRFADGSALQAIPNYARNNRGGRSRVWIDEP